MSREAALPDVRVVARAVVRVVVMLAERVVAIVVIACLPSLIGAVVG
jgi:hypothetical protein